MMMMTIGDRTFFVLALNIFMAMDASFHPIYAVCKISIPIFYFMPQINLIVVFCAWYMPQPYIQIGIQNFSQNG